MSGLLRHVVPHGSTRQLAQRCRSVVDKLARAGYLGRIVTDAPSEWYGNWTDTPSFRYLSDGTWTYNLTECQELADSRAPAVTVRTLDDVWYWLSDGLGTRYCFERTRIVFATSETESLLPANLRPTTHFLVDPDLFPKTVLDEKSSEFWISTDRVLNCRFSIRTEPLGDVFKMPVATWAILSDFYAARIQQGHPRMTSWKLCVDPTGPGLAVMRKSRYGRMLVMTPIGTADELAKKHFAFLSNQSRSIFAGYEYWSPAL
jgi:hypothetical protein